MRLAIVASHPIQYYVPLYRRLASRSDIEIKVFFTWHGGTTEVFDQGFKQPIAWDIPLTDGYESEVVPNTARRPGTHHFLGLQNPELIGRVKSWKPDAVHLTGYSFVSHLSLMRATAISKIPLLFRGDSHLLDETPNWKNSVKRIVLKRVFRWPSAFLYVGEHNKEYYRSFGVPEKKLSYCPHSIEVNRFAEPSSELEQKARQWRKELKIPEDTIVGLFAGKFETKKRPIDLMKWALESSDKEWILVMAGNGEHEVEVRRIANANPHRFRILPFQNQTKMPVLYRLGDFLILPSAYGETWGLAINEVQACGRPALVSDRVGCAPEMILVGVTGEIFSSDWGVRPPRVISGAPWRHDPKKISAPLSLRKDSHTFFSALNNITSQIRCGGYNRDIILHHARQFDVSETEARLMACLTALKNYSGPLNS